MNFQKTILAALISSATASAAFAQDEAETTQTNQPNKDQLVETVIVSDTRTESSLEGSLASASVFTRVDIEKMQATSITEVLERIPGVQVTNSGGKGSLTSVFLRGTDTNQTLILIDGVRISSATSGSTAIQHIDPDQIERIEVVKGMRSSIYGPDAVGGVIHIFTRKGDGELSGSVKATVGSNAYKKVLSNIGGSVDNLRYSVALSVEDSDGFDATTATTDANGDDDSYDNTTASFGLGYSFNENSVVGLSYFNSEGDTEYDNNCYIGYPVTTPCEPLNKHEVEKLAIDGQFGLGKMLELKFLVANSSDLTEVDDNLATPALVPSIGEFFETKRDSASVQLDSKLSEDSIIISTGLDYHNDKVDSNSINYSVDSRDNLGIFAQGQFELGALQLIAGVRNDDNEQYGNEVTYSFSAGLNAGDNMLFTASWATGVNNPTFNDLYYSSAFFNGNPDLDPETSESIDLGFKYNSENANFTFNIYQYDFEDLIINVPDPSNPPWGGTAANVQEAEINGWEASYSQQLLEGHYLAISYSYTDTENKDTGNTLVRRPLHNFSMDYSGSVGEKFSYGLTMFAQSDSYDSFDSAGNKVRLVAFGTIDARASWQLSEKFSLDAKVQNLFDKEYYIADTFSSSLGFYETGGRMYYLSGRYTF